MNQNSSLSNSTDETSSRLSPSPSRDSKRPRVLKGTRSTDEDEKNSADGGGGGGGAQAINRRHTKANQVKSKRQAEIGTLDSLERVERGVRKSALKRLGDLNDDMIWKSVVSSNNHYDLSEISHSHPVPKGPSSHHVFLPFYPHKGSTDRWKVIGDALNNLIGGCIANGRELKEQILSYNGSYRSKWDLGGLVYYCYEMEQSKFFELCRTLAEMADLAINVDKILAMPIPFLRRQTNASICLSKRQIACLLSHAFFCTYPMRNVDPVKDKRFMSSSDSLSLPSINFSSLFKFSANEISKSKLNCIFHYFSRVATKMPSGKVIFKRQSVKDSIQWKKSRTRFTELHVTSYGRIEAEDGLLQVDFANKFVGGGVLGRGCVQEEILFLISPELIIARLFTEALDDNEVLIITGSEIYSRHRGYSSTFEWLGDYVDNTPSTKEVKLTQIVAMDARKFYRDEDQFVIHEVERELNKAYCGFYSECKGKTDVQLPAVSTGNWGCGAFGGDKHLKSLIQMMAAAEAGRDVCYLTHGDKELAEKMSEVHQLIRRHNLTVGDVYHIIGNYIEHLKIHNNYYSLKLYDYILEMFNFRPSEYFQPQSSGTAV